MEKPTRTVKTKFIIAEKGSKLKGTAAAVVFGTLATAAATQVLNDDETDNQSEEK